MNELFNESIQLLRNLIATPSISREEDKTADIISKYFTSKGLRTFRQHNNVWVKNKHWSEDKPTILLLSHHDTVKPNSSYTRDPYFPKEEDGRLYGLGSNDAGGALVSLLATFMNFHLSEQLPYNIILLACAEEEVSGEKGVSSVLHELGDIACAIVGEPTTMDLAIAEKGLLVLDCEVIGKAGHAARDEGENAIYKSLPDIQWLRTYEFSKISDLLGPVKMTVTTIQAGKLHNVVPEKCEFTVDIRINELYSHEEILSIIQKNVSARCTPRSMRLRSSLIDSGHPLVKAAARTGGEIYGSPTMSDKALLPFPTLKMGPGKSERSHTADEFILLEEINDGIYKYIKTLENLFNLPL